LNRRIRARSRKRTGVLLLLWAGGWLENYGSFENWVTVWPRPEMDLPDDDEALGLWYVTIGWLQFEKS
jgi:hypothetical protein